MSDRSGGWRPQMPRRCFAFAICLMFHYATEMIIIMMVNIDHRLTRAGMAEWFDIDII